MIGMMVVNERSCVHGLTESGDGDDGHDASGRDDGGHSQV